MEPTITFSVAVDWLFKLLGISLASIAIFQLRETQKRRMVEMYWKIADQYTSNECHERRVAIEEIQDWLKNEKIILGISNDDSYLDTRLIKKYIEVFHNAEHGSNKKELDIKARHHIRFLNQVGILVKKGLIDRDLLFGLIGTGLHIDYPTLGAILRGHIEAHQEKMYGNFEYLWNSYNKWRKHQ